MGFKFNVVYSSFVVFIVSVCGSLVTSKNYYRFHPSWEPQAEVNMCNTSQSAQIVEVPGRTLASHTRPPGSLGGLLQILRGRLLKALDRALDSDSLKLAEGVYLDNEYHQQQRLESTVLDSEPFLVAFLQRVVRLLETRTLRVKLGVMKETADRVRGLHRGYRHAFPMMVGSFMLLAAFTVPMGFQFLAVVGGKALVLSQIALFLALGGHLQRYMGWGGPHAAAPAPAGGFVQHDYYLRDDLRPWHREGSDTQLSNQQLQSYMTTN